MGRPGFALWRRLARRRQAERKARPTAERGPGFWHRLDAGLARARSLALNTLVLLVVGVFGWAVVEEVARDPVVIEPLLVPEPVAKAGWTGEVLARQMRDRVREINAGAGTFRRPDDYLFDREQADFVLPGGIVSIRTLVTVLRSVVNRPARRLVAEVIEFDGPERPAECDARSGRPPRYVLVGRMSNTKAQDWVVCADNVRDLPQPAGDRLMRAASPYVFASYQYTRDPALAKTLAEDILRDRSAGEDHPWALLLLGSMLADQKDFSGAIAKCEQAIARKPKFAHAYYNWGVTLGELKRWGEAIGRYEQAIRIDPNYAYAYYNWGNALLDLKRPEEAIGKFEQAIRIDPKDADYYNGWGNALRDLQRPDEAIGKYEQAIRIDPNYAYAYNNWGNALRDLQRPEEAIGKYEQAIRIDPSPAYAYNNWGNALRDLERPEEAIGKYEQAIRIDPNYADYYSNLALVLGDLGRRDEADAMFAKAECLRAGQSAESCTSAGIATAAGGAVPRAPE
ncbi:MAG: tetratricopeptide repeat protein [Rhizobiaceae bacterium]